MMGESELSNLLGFTRSDFHVEVDHMTDPVAYLKTLAPQLSTEDHWNDEDCEEIMRVAVEATDQVYS
jgi:hypothetical protein